jgi:hypothetical protein
MNRNRAVRRYVQLIMSFTAGLWLLAGSALGQSQAGSVSGKVLSRDGSVLPGVTVTLTGIGAPQTFVTTTDGEYRFLGLHPGDYTVSAELSGFGNTTRKAIVELRKNTEIDIEMAPSVAETITVTAESPVIDRREVGTGDVVNLEELQNIPSARDPWVVLQSVPGIQVDRVNVGGNASGQQSYFVGKGVERHQTEWNMDGVAVTDMATTGTSAFYYDFDSFDEMQVQTGGADPSIRTPGVHLNMVTKRGNNELKGSARWIVTDKQFQADATIPAEARDYLEEGGNSIDHIDDYGIEAGGALMRDRLWLWGAYSGNDIGNFSSGDALVATTELRNFNSKLNAQILSNNNAEVFFMWATKDVDARGLSPTRPLETARNQTSPGYIAKLQDTHIFSQNLYLTGTFAKIQNHWSQTPIGGMDVDAWWSEAGALEGVDAGWHRTYQYYYQSVPQTNARADGSAFVKTGDLNHELKFGFGYRDTPVSSGTVWPGNGNFGNFYDGYALAALTRPAVPRFGSEYFDSYIGDTVILGNFTLTGGLRFDIQRARNFASRVPANPVVPDLLPETSFAGDEKSLEWNGIAPRLGATWALGEDRKSIIKASYGRYLDQLGSSDVGSSNPFYRVQELYYYWEDLNGDRTVQREEIDFDSGLYSFDNIDPDNPGAGYSPGRLDYDMNPPTTDELIVGFTREIMPAFAVEANLSYRKRFNLLWDRYEKTRFGNDFYTSEDYSLGAVTTGTLPDGSPYSVQTYRLKAGLSAPVYYVTTNRDDYYQTYQGLELVANKRMTNHWMLRGNVTFMNWKQHVGSDAIVNPTPIVDGDSCTVCDGDDVGSSSGSDGYINARWAYSLNTAVELPWTFQLGAALTGREGYIIPYYRRVNNRDGLGNQDVMIVEEFGSSRLPNVMNVDLRLSRDFRVASAATLNVGLELFNATNERTVLWRDNRMYSANGPDIETNNWIETLQSPRVWRLGARVSF